MRLLLLCLLAGASCPSSIASEDFHHVPLHNAISSDNIVQSRQQAGVVAADIFLRRAYHGSVVAGNYVYIDGGAFSYTSGGSPQFEYSTTTLSIDLSESWTNSSVTINSNSKPSGVPNFDGNTLWYNAKENALYSGFGGRTPRFKAPSAYPLGLWTYALDGSGSGTWSAVSTATKQLSSSFTRPNAGLSAFGGDSAFTIGGTTGTATDPAEANATVAVPVSGIVQFNMTTGAFSNSSASGYNWNGTAERGVLHYVPSFGPEGLYVLLGGDISGLNYYTAGSELQSFAKLTIYDPSTRKFYNQTATGNIPESRIEFCATGANSTNGTYDIFLYAGWGSNLGAAALPFDEIYILTLPAFEWIKVQYSPAHPRHGHSCHTVANRQMLVIGGVDSLQDTAESSAVTSLDEATFQTADQFTQGLAIFDMTTLQFTNEYDATADAYEQSNLVKNYYASNSREPAIWGSPTLSSLFQVSNFATATSTSNPTISSPAQTSSSSSSSSTGAIAGGVVGGVLGIALLSALAFFLLRRRRKHANATELPAGSAGARTSAGGGYVAAPTSEYQSEYYKPEVHSPAATYEMTDRGGELGRPLEMEGGHGVQRQELSAANTQHELP